MKKRIKEAVFWAVVFCMLLVTAVGAKAAASPALESSRLVINVYQTGKDSEGYYSLWDGNEIRVNGLEDDSIVTVTSSSSELKVEAPYVYGGSASIYVYPRTTGSYTVTVNVDGTDLTCEVVVCELYFKRNAKTATEGDSTEWTEGSSMLALYKGESTTLVLKGVPSGGKVKWSSSNKSVASVSQSGKVTARGLGAATVTAKYEDFTLTYEVGVSYKDAVSALRYCFKHYGSTYSQKNRMEEGSYDCSSFVWRAYHSVSRNLGNNKNWAPTAADLAKWCTDNNYMVYSGTVSVANLLPGDLIFECDPSGANGRYEGIYHVDMYQGNQTSITVERQKTYWGTLNNVMIARPCLAKTAGLTAKASASGIQLKWSSSYGANGYQVYRSTSKTGKFTKIATVKNAASWKDAKAKAGSTYYYKVRAYWKGDGHTYKGGFSAVVQRKAKAVAAAKLSAPKVQLKKNSGGTVKLSWGKITGADGYVVTRSTSKKGTYKTVKTIKKGSTINFTQKKLKKGTTYYYKVKAYKTSGGKKQYSSESAVIKVKVK